jgi:hypothetical protein
MLDCVYEPANWCDAQLTLNQECINLRSHVAWLTKFCTVASNICGSSVWNLLLVTLLASRILGWLLDFQKFVHPYMKCVSNEDKIIKFNTRLIYEELMLDKVAVLWFSPVSIIAVMFPYSNFVHLLWMLDNLGNC